jgi:hypothetical protein
MSFNDCVDEKNWLESKFSLKVNNKSALCEQIVKTPFYEQLQEMHCYRHLAHTPTFYVHVIANGNVDSDGNVLTNGIALVPYQPTPMWNTLPNDIQTISEVFILKQQYGEAVYHVMCDQLPRIAAYLTFLKNNPQIKIALFKNTSL